jgi:hypothetical protein
MLEKSSVLTMVLLATGSLIGISSMYQPANVETQLGLNTRSQEKLAQPPPGIGGLITRDQQQQFESLLRNYLTGVWKGSDQGTYYVRQVGDNIMWLGMSANDGKFWTNAFAGKIAGDRISGTWVDVPRGGVKGLGTLTLQVSQVGPKIVMQKIGSTGSGFGTSSWEKQ